MQWLTELIGANIASPWGVAAIAALDSTIFLILPFGVDAAVIVLAARGGHWAWVAPVIAAVAATAGAAITYWMGAALGESALERYVSAERLARVRAVIGRRGAVIIALLDLVPPPFPYKPFLLAAGTFEVARVPFFVALLLTRLLRFGVEAALADRYATGIEPWRGAGVGGRILLAAVAVAAVGAILSAIRFMRAARGRADRAPRE